MQIIFILFLLYFSNLLKINIKTFNKTFNLCKLLTFIFGRFRPIGRGEPEKVKQGRQRSGNRLKNIFITLSKI